MVKKAKLNHGMQDFDLTDTLIGQSFNNDILKYLSPSQSDVQTDFDTPKSDTERHGDWALDTLTICCLPPVPGTPAAVEGKSSQGRDQLSMSQLCQEQHSDPEISPLCERAFQ